MNCSTIVQSAAESIVI